MPRNATSSALIDQQRTVQVVSKTDRRRLSGVEAGDRALVRWSHRAHPDLLPHCCGQWSYTGAWLVESKLIDDNAWNGR